MNTPEQLALERTAPRGAAAGWRHRTHHALFLAVLACLGLSGCSTFWDDVTSRDFEMKSLVPWQKPPDPLVTLHDSKDGDHRAKAYRLMTEPVVADNPELREQYVKELCEGVLNERTSLCRQAAIASLRTYKDPRVSKALQEAFDHLSGYDPNTASILRCQILEALGQVGTPDALDLLIKVVKQPPLSKNDPLQQQNQLLQERLAAARALGHFREVPAAETLVAVLKNEKDPAMRNVAHVSLEMETGKRFPDDAVAWDQYLHTTEDKNTLFGSPSISDQFMDVIINVSWWK